MVLNHDRTTTGINAISYTEFNVRNNGNENENEYRIVEVDQKHLILM